MQNGAPSPLPLTLFLRAANGSAHPFDVGNALYLIHQARDEHDIAPGQIFLRSSTTTDARRTMTDLAQQLHQGAHGAIWRTLNPCATSWDYLALVLAMSQVATHPDRVLLVCVVDEPFFRRTDGSVPSQDFFTWAVTVGLLPPHSIDDIPRDHFEHEAGVELDLREREPRVRYYGRRATFDLSIPL